MFSTVRSGLFSNSITFAKCASDFSSWEVEFRGQKGRAEEEKVGRREREVVRKER